MLELRTLPTKMLIPSQAQLDRNSGTLRYRTDMHLFHDTAKEVWKKPFVQPLVRIEFCSSRS